MTFSAAYFTTTKEVISTHDIHSLKVDNIYELDALLFDWRSESQS
jgi:hypothetical protein